MKRIIGAAAAGVVAFSGIYALAASLSVTTNTLGAGTTAVAACQSATLNVAYGPSYVAGSGYETTTVTITNLQSTCYSVPYKVTLYGAAGASLGEVTGTTPSSGSTITTGAFSPLVSDASVQGVAVVLGG